MPDGNEICVELYFHSTASTRVNTGKQLDEVLLYDKKTVLKSLFINVFYAGYALDVFFF